MAPTDFDTVTEEAAHWADLDRKIIRESRDDDGIVNEFALMYHLHQSFPLHFIVFKQTASHLPHEGNTANSSSRARAPSPMTMARWTRRTSRSGRPSAWTTRPRNYQPTDKQILECYMLKFSKGGKATAAEMHTDDLGLLVCSIRRARARPRGAKRESTAAQ